MKDQQETFLHRVTNTWRTEAARLQITTMRGYEALRANDSEHAQA